MNKVPKSIENQDEINLLELYDQLKRQKPFILTFTGIFTIFSILYSFLSTPLYKSYVSIYPSVTDSSLNTPLGDIQGVASAFGFNIEGSDKVAFYIPDIVNSRRLQKTIIQNRWISDDHDQPIDLISYWEIDDPTKLNKRFKKLINSFLPAGRKTDPHRKYLESALIELEDRITVEEEDSGLNTIMIHMEEPGLSADIGNFIAQFIKSYISDEMDMQSRKYRQFIEERFESAEKELKGSEEELTEFRKKHAIALEPPEMQLLRARLMRNVEVNQEVYVTLRQQYELAKIEELKESPIINILDQAEPPSDKDKPRRLLIILMTMFGSFSIAVIIAIFRYSIRIESDNKV